MYPRQVEWWYWLATVVLLSVGLAGFPEVVVFAIALTGVQVFHFAVRTVGLKTFSVQLRAAYLALLLLGLWPPLSFVHWIQFIGTWAIVLTDYCFLARCLSLLPWNRRAPLTPQHVANTFFSRPVRGSIFQATQFDGNTIRGRSRT